MAEMICHMCGQGYTGKHECNDVHIPGLKPSDVCPYCDSGQPVRDYACVDCEKKAETQINMSWPSNVPEWMPCCICKDTLVHVAGGCDTCDRCLKGV